jgi:predicted O-methyltransferase YrrM
VDAGRARGRRHDPVGGRRVDRAPELCVLLPQRAALLEEVAQRWDPPRDRLEQSAGSSDGLMTLREQILWLARESGSARRIETIRRGMAGSTFHGHIHLLYDLRTLLGEGKRTYVEIGVYHGGSLSLMLQHPYETAVHGIDPFVLPRQAEFTAANVEKFNTRGRNVFVHAKYSHDPELLRQLDALAIDLLFIDGDHHAESVARDFDLYAPKVRPGGFVVFDDYHDTECSPEVRPAVDSIVGRVRGEYEIVGSLPNAAGAEPADMAENNMCILGKAHRLALSTRQPSR